MKKYFLFFLSLVFSIHSFYGQNVVYVYGDVAADGTIPSGGEKPFHQMRLNDEARLGLSGFKKAIEDTGMNIIEVYDAETTFDIDFLKNVDVLILGSNQKQFNDSEINSISKWVKKGGGLVAWSDSAFGGHFRIVGLDNSIGRDSDNLITEQFGMRFLTDNGGGNYLISEYTKDHFINNYNKNGGVRFRGEGVSFVRVSTPAITLSIAQEGGLGGKLKVNKIDGEFNKETDVSLAIAEIEKGRVLGLFDRNMLWNAGDGTNINHSDNREFVQRIILWAAGIEDNSRISSQKEKNIGINNIPKIELKSTLVEDQSKVVFLADIDDDDTDGLLPEISWKLKKGPAKVNFENNNTNTTNPVAMLPVKGVYIFVATIKDGEFTIRKQVVVNKEK